MGRKSPRDSTWIRNLHQNKNTSIRIQYHPVAKENYKNTAEFKVFWNKKKTAIKRLCWTLFTDKRLSEHHQNLFPCEENAGRFFFLGRDSSCHIDYWAQSILSAEFSTSINCLYAGRSFLLVLLRKNGMWFYEISTEKKILVKNNPIINLDLSELDKKII